MQQWDTIKHGLGIKGIAQGLENYWFEYGREPESLRQAWLREAENLLDPDNFWLAAPLFAKAGGLTEQRYKTLEPWLLEAQSSRQVPSDDMDMLIAACFKYLPETEAELLESCREGDEVYDYSSDIILDYMIMAGSSKAVAYVLDWLQGNLQKILSSSHLFEHWLIRRIGSLNRVGVKVPQKLLTPIQDAVYSHFPFLAPDAQLSNIYLYGAQNLNVFFELGMQNELKDTVSLLVERERMVDWARDESVREFLLYGNLSHLLLVCSLSEQTILDPLFPEFFKLFGELSNNSQVPHEFLPEIRAALEIATWRRDYQPIDAE